MNVHVKVSERLFHILPTLCSRYYQGTHQMLIQHKNAQLSNFAVTVILTVRNSLTSSIAFFSQPVLIITHQPVVAWDCLYPVTGQ